MLLERRATWRRSGWITGVAGLVMAVAAVVGRQPTWLGLGFALSCTGRGEGGGVGEFGKDGEKVLPQARGGTAAPWCAVEVLSPADGWTDVGAVREIAGYRQGEVARR